MIQFRSSGDGLRILPQANLPGGRVRRLVLLPLQGGVAPDADVRRGAAVAGAAAARPAAAAYRHRAR